MAEGLVKAVVPGVARSFDRDSFTDPGDPVDALAQGAVRMVRA